jgi:hypothetical protein
MPHCGKRQGKLCRTCEKEFAPAVEKLGIQQVFSSGTGQ